MFFLRCVTRCSQLLFLGLGWGTLLCGTALAQLPAEVPKDEKNYAMSYLFAALLITLGCLLVLRATMRQKEFRPPAS